MVLASFLYHCPAKLSHCCAFLPFLGFTPPPRSWRIPPQRPPFQGRDWPSIWSLFKGRGGILVTMADPLREIFRISLILAASGDSLG